MTLLFMHQPNLFPDDKTTGKSPLHAPPIGLVRRAVAKAVALLHALDRSNHTSSRQIRRILFSDAGAQLSPHERLFWGNHFRASIWQRQQLSFYWITDGTRHITTRAMFETKLPRRRLPPSAIWIGNYQVPVHENQFLDDLDDLLAKIRAGVAINVPAEE